jgi:ABC-type ATPase involved in cell division/GNAT superfamily N-acetyltransferase
MKVDLKVESEIVHTTRVRQLSAIFDAPISEKLSHSWSGDVPIEERDWNIGLIVGPSGAGKSSVMRQMFGEPKTFEWKASSIIDDFAVGSIEDITGACQAVGFNTIPSWAKPHAVLSTGEKFRVELARHLLEGGDPIVIDEFTSVVDRQVAHIGSHAVQKYIRKHSRKFVAVTCHYDVVEWLQPDWVLEPATMTFHWRSLQRRPGLNVEIARVDKSAWKLFAPFHYLTAELHLAAKCFVLFVNGVPASFAGVLHRPHARVDDIKGISRNVTLPDYQGMGLAYVLVDTMGAAYKAMGYRLRSYPAHPALVRASDKSKNWSLKKKPGNFSPVLGKTSTLKFRGVPNPDGGDNIKKWNMGSRPCAVFEYCGPTMDLDEANRLING